MKTAGQAAKDLIDKEDIRIWANSIRACNSMDNQLLAAMRGVK